MVGAKGFDGRAKEGLDDQQQGGELAVEASVFPKREHQHGQTDEDAGGPQLGGVERLVEESTYALVEFEADEWERGRHPDLAVQEMIAGQQTRGVGPKGGECAVTTTGEEATKSSDTHADEDGGGGDVCQLPEGNLHGDGGRAHRECAADQTAVDREARRPKEGRRIGHCTLIIYGKGVE